MIRRILPVCVTALVALCGVAWAATAGTYSGTSVLTISGVQAKHPFSLTVKHGKVVDISLIAGSNCADLNGSAGVKANLTISHTNTFSGTVRVNRFVLKFAGAFKGKVVTGSFAGTARGISSSCPVPKNTFKATR